MAFVMKMFAKEQHEYRIMHYRQNSNNNCIYTFIFCSFFCKIADNVCVPMPTQCTIKRFWFHTTWIDDVKCGLFSNHAPLGQTTLRVGWVDYLYSVLEKVEVMVTVSVTVCVVQLCCAGWWWKEGRKWNPVPAHSLLCLKSTKEAARLNVPNPTDESLSTVLHAFSTYILRKGLEFNPGLWCTI